MHKDIALADLKLPHTMVHYQPLVKPLKKKTKQVEKWVIGGKSSICL
jgi:hypothetical protein